MISSEKAAVDNPEVASNAEIAFDSQAYDTIMQDGPTGVPGSVTGLLLGVPAHGLDGPLRIVVTRALTLSLAADGPGFLLDQKAIGELAALTPSGDPAPPAGWFHPHPARARSPGMGGCDQSERLVAINRNRW